MNDTLQRFLFEHAPIRGEVAHLDATWRAVLERHEYPPVLRTVLGELMAAGALLAATLKFDGSIILQLQGVLESLSPRQQMALTAGLCGLALLLIILARPHVLSGESVPPTCVDPGSVYP